MGEIEPLRVVPRLLDRFELGCANRCGRCGDIGSKGQRTHIEERGESERRQQKSGKGNQ